MFMDNTEFALKVIWNSFSDVIKVNVVSGEFTCLKCTESLRDFKDIYAFFESSENLSQVFVHDRKEYESFTSRDNLLASLSSSDNNSFSYRRIINGRYKWVHIEFIKDDDFSLENPFVILTRKAADEKTCSDRIALKGLSYDFHKVLQVNLADDSFTILKIRDGENPVSSAAKTSLSVWFNEVNKFHCIHIEDLEIFKRMTNREYMRKFFLERKGNLRVRYRRMFNEQWRWFILEAIPVNDFSLENQNIMIYVRDIEEEYAEQISHQRSIEKICYEDFLTGIGNRLSYNVFVNELKQQTSGSFGVIFCDLNGLKYINDNYGHNEGDKYIKDFSDFLRKSFRTSSCFRIGGDEFVVLLKEMPEAVFEQRVLAFEKALLNLEEISVSVGSSWSLLPAKFSSVVERAEKEMYLVKKEAHRFHPEYVR